jgi:putative hydrolase of the HAD superfamily
MKYIAVDLGDVICRVDFDNFKKQLSIAANISLDDAEYFLNRTQKSHDLGLSSLSDELHDHFKIKSEPLVNGLVKEWNKTVIVNKMMKHFLEEMIDKGTEVALLSNIGIDHSSIIEGILGEVIYKNSVKFFSCNVGARKPSLLYYKTFLDMYPKFASCLYIDDRPENIEAAKLFGFNAVVFELSKMDDHQLEEKLNYFRSL